MEILKTIAYAYPSSENAVKLGFAKTGCYYIELIRNKFHEPILETGAISATDAELLSRFRNHPGRVCPYFIKYASHSLIEAIALTC